MIIIIDDSSEKLLKKLANCETLKNDDLFLSITNYSEATKILNYSNIVEKAIKEMYIKYVIGIKINEEEKENKYDNKNSWLF